MIYAVECGGIVRHSSGMPTYHLHLHNAHIDASDEEGIELADIAAAHAKAIQGIRGFLAHEAIGGRIDLRGQVDIADDAGAILKTVSFAEAITIIR